jgi:hypothetical protein
MPRADNLPYQFLLKASVPTLESFELSRLNHAANLKKQISALIDQYLDESAAALLARAMIMRMNHARPHSVDRKRQLLAPRSNGSKRVLATARSISTTRALSASGAIHGGRAASTERMISPTRAIASTRAVLRPKSAGDLEIQHGMRLDLFAKRHAR